MTAAAASSRVRTRASGWRLPPRSPPVARASCSCAATASAAPPRSPPSGAARATTTLVQCDMGDLDAVRMCSAGLRATHPRIDAATRAASTRSSPFGPVPDAEQARVVQEFAGRLLRRRGRTGYARGRRRNRPIVGLVAISHPLLAAEIVPRREADIRNTMPARRGRLFNDPPCLSASAAAFLRSQTNRHAARTVPTAFPTPHRARRHDSSGGRPRRMRLAAAADLTLSGDAA